MVSSAIQARPLFYEALHAQVNVPRDEVLKDIEKQLDKSQRFVALQGSAGSGKSYFLRHQLVPHYQELARREEKALAGPWRVVTFSPQVNPIGTLATALAAPGALRRKGATQPFFREQLERRLRAGNDGLVKVYQEAVEAAGQPFRLLIIVDQLEDMFKLGDELRKDRSEDYQGLGKFFQPGDDTLFFNLFLKLLKTELPVYVVFSISSENLDRINAFPGWPERISMHRYALPQVKPEALKEALTAFWPAAAETAMPAGARTLYGEMLEAYKTVAAQDKEPVARVNIALKLLYQEACKLLEKPFKTLTDPPEFITRALAKEETAEKRAPHLIAAFLDKDNQRTWRDWEDHLSTDNKSKWQTAISKFFADLLEAYQKFGGLEGAPEHLFNKLYEQLKEEERSLAARLFQTITLKDPAPERVAESYSTPFAMLSEVCFRAGEEYPDILKELKVGTGIGTTDKGAEKAANKEMLRAVIRHFNFPGGTVPDMVRWINPAGHSGSSENVYLHEEMIIKLGPSSLVQEWGKLRQWVDDENNAGNLYKKLVQDAIIHHREEKNKIPEATASAPEQVPLSRPSLLRALWARILGTMSLIWRGAANEQEEGQKRDRTLLSEGGVELVGEWFLETLPSAAWASKYRSAQVITDPDSADPSAFEKWIDEDNETSFSLVTKFWEKSNNYHRRRRQQEEARMEQEVRIQRRVSKIFAGLAGAAVICGIAAGFYAWEATNAENNLDLLDFVDNMTKANLISSNIYRSQDFQELKLEIEGNRKIKKKVQVISVLDTSGVLHFPQGADMARYNDLSFRSLLYLDELIDNYHDKTPEALSAITSSITAVADSAIALNGRSGKNYQFPYVYQSLWENYGALHAAIHGVEKGTSADRGMVFQTHAQITAVVSNPQVKNQYAIGDGAGQVRIMLGGERVFDRVATLPESISSLQYSLSGRQLYATSYGGNIYRLEALKSGATELSPLGVTDSLVWQRLDVNWKREGAELAILSIHNTALPDHLVVVGDNNVALIRKERGENSYLLVQDFPMKGHLTALTVARGNQEGTKFLIGGSNASVLFTFDALTKKLDWFRKVEHPHTSVSAIAFQPLPASRDRAPQNSEATQQKIAVGTKTGDIWITDIGAFSATGNQQERLLELINERAADTVNRNYQESAVTGLAFNQTKNDQLISSSLDGTVWLFNLDAAPPIDRDFLSKGPEFSAWDHQRLITTGRSVDNICLINADQVVAVENNTLRSWPTNLYSLRREVDELLSEIIPPQK